MAAGHDQRRTPSPGSVAGVRLPEPSQVDLVAPLVGFPHPVRARAVRSKRNPSPLARSSSRLAAATSGLSAMAFCGGPGIPVVHPEHISSWIGRPAPCDGMARTGCRRRRAPCLGPSCPGACRRWLGSAGTTTPGRFSPIVQVGQWSPVAARSRGVKISTGGDWGSWGGQQVRVPQRSSSAAARAGGPSPVADRTRVGCTPPGRSGRRR